MRSELGNAESDLGEGVVRKALSHDLAESTHDFPLVAGLSWRSHGQAGDEHTAVDVDVGSTLLGVARI